MAKKFVCTVCGSDRVLLDAYARWDVEKQEMVVESVIKGHFCELCGGDCSVEEVSIPAPGPGKADEA